MGNILYSRILLNILGRCCCIGNTKSVVWLNQRVYVCLWVRKREKWERAMEANIYNDYYCFCRTLFVHLSVREYEFIADGCIKQSPIRVFYMAMVVEVVAVVFIAGHRRCRCCYYCHSCCC